MSSTRLASPPGGAARGVEPGHDLLDVPAAVGREIAEARVLRQLVELGGLDVPVLHVEVRVELGAHRLHDLDLGA